MRHISNNTCFFFVLAKVIMIFCYHEMMIRKERPAVGWFISWFTKCYFSSNLTSLPLQWQCCILPLSSLHPHHFPCSRYNTTMHLLFLLIHGACLMHTSLCSTKLCIWALFQLLLGFSYFFGLSGGSPTSGSAAIPTSGMFHGEVRGWKCCWFFGWIRRQLPQQLRPTSETSAPLT